MILTDKSATPRELHPAGWTRAISIRVIDLGMQNGFQGKTQHKCRILFETEHRYTEGDNKGKRFLISDKLTASLSEKANLRKVLEAAGSDLAHVVQTRNYVRDADDVPLFNTLYREYFSAPFPARTTITNCLPPSLRYEIEAVAVHRR